MAAYRLDSLICLIGYQGDLFYQHCSALVLYSKLLYFFSVQVYPGDFTINATQNVEET